jgi:NADH-quinone oxidoreductase subunit H
LQPLADVIKLVTKEDTVPDEADRPVFAIAPIALLAPTLLTVAVIPFGENSFLGSLNIGILFIVGVTSLNTFAIFMGGWASRNKYAMFGAMRGVAMLISYEVPMAIAITGVLLLSGSLALTDIVASQDVPFLLVQPLGFLVFLAASAAEISRTPFDQIEAESELGSGYHTEFSGMKYAVFQLAEFMAPVVTALVITTLYLSGTRGFDPIPGQVWFVAKVFAVVFALLWFRATWPRLRIDQIMGLAWKGLFALALVNLLLVAVEVQLLQDADSGALSVNTLWLMGAINWLVTIVSIVAVANVLGQRRLQRRTPVPSPLANMNPEVG